MHVDVFSDIGSSHRICQDYSSAEKQTLILSDGCSSAPDTDFGSRLLIKATQFVLNQNCILDTQPLLYSIINTANVYSKSLQLSEDCLAATLLFSRLENNNYTITVIGDGAIVLKPKSDEIFLIVYNFKYPSGAPYYLRYELDSKLKESYFESFGNLFIIEKISYSFSMQVIDKTETIINVEKNNFYFEETFDLEQFETISIFTDGIYSFMQNNSYLPYELVMKEFLLYKSYAGEFVRRRCNKVLNVYKKNSINHFDDFSMGTIYTGTEK